MTQEQKELLLKDLCGRLPYKVKAQIPDEYGGYTSAIESIDNDGYVVDFEGIHIEIEFIKPYLFPLSSMTEEQKNDCPINETTLNIINSNIGCYGIIEIPWRLSFLFIDWCNKNHFDYRGLIPMDLANDATGLNIY